MSEVSKMIEEVLWNHMHEGLWKLHSQTNPDKLIEQIEQAIKAEVMGLDVDYDDSFEHYTIKLSDLEKLFGEGK